MSFHRAQISFKWGENNVREKKETRYPKICEWEKIRPASFEPQTSSDTIQRENQHLGHHAVKFLSNGAVVDGNRGMGGGKIRSSFREMIVIFVASVGIWKNKQYKEINNLQVFERVLAKKGR